MIANILKQKGFKVKGDRLWFGASWYSITGLFSKTWYMNTKFNTLILTPQVRVWLERHGLDRAEQVYQQEIQKFVVEDEARQAKEEEEKKQQDMALNPVQERLLQTHCVITDMANPTEILWNVKNRRVSEWNLKAYLSKFPAAWKLKLIQEARLGLQVFDPFKGTQSMWGDTKEGHEVVMCNVYIPPIWYDRNLNPADYINRQEIYPSLFIEFLKRLVPHPTDIHYVLDWLSLALFDRPHSILSLRGARGNGKSLFKQVVYHLVGNFVEAQQNVWGDFNAEMRNKRIVGIDDNPKIGTREGHNLRKRLTNPTITFNTKHVQSTVSEKMFASLIMCSNDNEDPFYVEYDERKLVCPGLTKKKMEKWPGVHQGIWDFLRAFEVVDSEQLPDTHVNFLRGVGEALFVRYTQRRPNVSLEYFGGTFWTDVVESLPSFKRYVLTYIVKSHWADGIELEYEVFKADYSADHGRGNVPQWPAFKRWLTSNFHVKGQNLVISIDNERKTFVPNPRLRGVL